MVRLFVRHNVMNFAEWKEEYDSFEAARQEMGVQGAAVYQAVDDPNDVTVWHDFETLEAAQAFMNSQELRERMNEAGVAGPPAVWFVQKV